MIYPIFLEEGENIKNEIESMPGFFRYSLDRIDEELDALVELGINSILLFGIPKHKDECANWKLQRRWSHSKCNSIY